MVKMLQFKSCEFVLPILLALHTFSWPPSAHSAKILGLFAHPSESHFAVMRSVMLELAKREHNVTVYSSHRLNERVENLREVIVEPEFPFWQQLQEITITKARGGLHQLAQLPAATLQTSLAAVGAAAVDYFLTHAAVHELLHLPSAAFDYDLIVVDLFYTEALLAVGHFHATPTVGIVSTNFESYMQHVLEQLVPTACSPVDDYETYTPSVGYWQRLGAIRGCISRRKQFAKANWSAQQRLIQKHFAHFPAAASLSIATLQSEMAVLLLNNHIPLATPRPLLPNTIAAGGMHIRRPQELPWHIRRFLDEARAGVIYMHLGNEQLCADIAQPTLQLLFRVLGKRAERVLWTCHDVQQLDGQPKNMLVQHDVPQADILAHPYVRAFIMNGDLLSLQEGIVRHVPMLGIPIFRNERQNMALAVRLGAAIQLQHDNLTETSLNWALDTLTKDTTYPLTIREVAAAFRDRPLGALETCIYWMDFVLRHQGGAQLKTRGVGIPSNQLHLFDLFIYYFVVALLLVGVLGGAVYGVIWLLQRRQAQILYNTKAR